MTETTTHSAHQQVLDKMHDIMIDMRSPGHRHGRT